MIELPGCRSGRWISARPVSGPEPIQRMSLAILVSDTAMVRSAPDASTNPSRAAWASKEFAAVRNSLRPVFAISASTTLAPKPSGALRPVPTAVPPVASSPSRGGGDVGGGREGVVGRLRHVDVVVGVHGDAVGRRDGRDHLVGVHVGTGA